MSSTADEPDTSATTDGPPVTSASTVPVGGRRAAGKARTRAAIIGAAVEVFADRGYAAAALEEVARTAGVAIGSIYAHFGSKQDLFMAIINHHLSTRLDDARHTLTDTGPAAAPLAETVIAALDDRRSALIDAEAWLYSVRHDDDLARRLRAHYRGVLGAAHGIVTHYRRPDDGLPFHDHELALVLVAVIHGLARQRFIDPPSVPDQLVGRVLAALGAHDTGP